MNKPVAIIGAGVAGLTAANALTSMGIPVVVVEGDSVPGGHVSKWDRLFPNGRPAREVVEALLENYRQRYEIRFNTQIDSIIPKNGGFFLFEKEHPLLECSAVILANGFKLFDAARKEEYGHGIYNHVITSAELEAVFKSGQPLRVRNNDSPERVAIIHCVGSRDEKVGNRYCSKVCCVTGVKQAIEVRQMLPTAEVFCFYMDLRMFDRHFEELYLEARQRWGVNFIRGRLSECSEQPDHKIILKTEDTLTGKPLKMTVDLVVLLVGFTPPDDLPTMVKSTGVVIGDDGFLSPSDGHLCGNLTNVPGLFITGAVKGPSGIPSVIADAKAVALVVSQYLQSTNI